MANSQNVIRSTVSVEGFVAARFCMQAKLYIIKVLTGCCFDCLPGTDRLRLACNVLHTLTRIWAAVWWNLSMSSWIVFWWSSYLMSSSWGMTGAGIKIASTHRQHIQKYTTFTAALRGCPLSGAIKGLSLSLSLSALPEIGQNSSPTAKNVLFLIFNLPGSFNFIWPQFSSKTESNVCHKPRLRLSLCVTGWISLYPAIRNSRFEWLGVSEWRWVDA